MATREKIKGLSRPIRNRAQGVAFLVECCKFLGWGFHPDDPAGDYVQMASGRPTFTPDEQAKFDKRMAEAFRHVEDPYVVGLDWLNEHSPQEGT